MKKFLVLPLALYAFTLHVPSTLADDEKSDEEYLWFPDPLWGVSVTEFEKTNY